MQTNFDDDAKGVSSHCAAGWGQLEVVRDVLQYVLERELQRASPLMPFALLHQR